MFRAFFLASLVAAAPVLAQDDDDLPSLPAAKPKPKAQPKPRPKPKPKQPVANDDDLPALPPQKGDLVVKLGTPVKNAKLSIDDREIGTLPQPAQNVTQGEHTITVRRLGYAPFNKKVNVLPNKANEVTVSLDATAAVLTVSSDVAGAQVFVNGRLAGTAPLYELEVPPGSIEIAVKKDGYHDGSQTLAAKAGRDYPVEVRLGAPIASTVVAANVDAPVNTSLTPGLGSEPITGTSQSVDNGTPIYKTWWFWTAVAVVVAAGVVGGVYAANSSGGGGGPLLKDYPCQNNGMMCDGWVNKPSAIVPIGF